MKKKALIAMSGGVDSSVAAYLLKQQGYDCIGVTMKLFDNEDIGEHSEKSCCSLEDAESARSVAYLLDMPYYVFNYSDDFRNRVIDKFVDVYQSGATPNPCIDCNRYMKFEKLLLRAGQLDMNYIATGHYARIEQDASTGRYILKKAADKTKDQSYVLYTMTQEQLAHTLFPLGELCKSDIRAIAAEQGFSNANKRDSQDICFVRDGDYAGFIEQYTGHTSEPGDFTDICGNVLGRHRGLIRYTIGQRRGLGLSLPQPMYVYSKNTHNNTITLCNNEQLYTKILNAKDVNWIVNRSGPPESPLKCKAKLRYSHKEQPATVTHTSADTVHIEFDKPQRAVTPGQSVVFYDNDTVLGGGIII